MPHHNRRLNNINVPVCYLRPTGYRAPAKTPAYPWLKEVLGWGLFVMLLYINVVIYMGGF